MAGVTITVDDSEVNALFERLGAFGDAPMRAALVDIGEHLFNTTLERAAKEIDPDGIPWVPLSPRYAKRKGAVKPGVPILRFDNHMLGDMFHPQPGDGFVDLGTNAIYGAAQQFGSNGIPAREFLGLSDQDAIDVREILGEHLQQAIDGS